jgi:DNA-binding NarL/FixJ family response regulator
MSEQIKLLQAIENATTLEAKFSLFTGFMRDEFKFDGVHYGIYLNTSSHRDIYSHFVPKRTGLSDEWRDRYRKGGYVQFDLSLFLAAVRQDPMMQSAFYQGAQSGDLPTPFARVVAEVQDYVKGGVVIPVNHNGQRGVIGLYNRNGCRAKNDAHYARHRFVIETLASHFHKSCHWADEIVEQKDLSDMNLTVLRLKAQGLRVKEILYQIDRANPKTVDIHMARVRKALGTRNDMETIAKAGQLGLLNTGDMPPPAELHTLPEVWRHL